MAFYVYKSPLVTRTSFDFGRRIMNPAYLWFYRKWVEPNFTLEGFLNGAKQSATLTAALIQEQRFDRLHEFMTRACVNQLRLRTSEFSQDQIDKYFKFKMDDIVKVLHHSSLVSSLFLAERGNDSYNFTFYSTFAMYIDTVDHTDRTISQLLKGRNDILICNLTVARLLHPLGKWRITDVNFFNNKFINIYDNSQLVNLI